MYSTVERIIWCVFTALQMQSVNKVSYLWLWCRDRKATGGSEETQRRRKTWRGGNRNRPTKQTKNHISCRYVQSILGILSFHFIVCTSRGGHESVVVGRWRTQARCILELTEMQAVVHVYFVWNQARFYFNYFDVGSDVDFCVRIWSDFWKRVWQLKWNFLILNVRADLHLVFFFVSDHSDASLLLNNTNVEDIQNQLEITRPSIANSSIVSLGASMMADVTVHNDTLVDNLSPARQEPPLIDLPQNPPTPCRPEDQSTDQLVLPPLPPTPKTPIFCDMTVASLPDVDQSLLALNPRSVASEMGFEEDPEDAIFNKTLTAAPSTATTELLVRFGSVAAG